MVGKEVIWFSSQANRIRVDGSVGKAVNWLERQNKSAVAGGIAGNTAKLSISARKEYKPLGSAGMECNGLYEMDNVWIPDGSGPGRLLIRLDEKSRLTNALGNGSLKYTFS